MSAIKINRERINQAIFEIAIITVSILLAFALERWWDDRVDSRSKDELVSLLMQEFQSAKAELQVSMETHRERLRGVSKLNELDAQTIAEVDPVEISDYWYWAVTPDETYPPNGALQSAINDNRLTLLDSPVLQSRLASWTGRLQDLRQTERVVAEYTLQTFWPNVATDVVIPLNREAIGRETDEVILRPATKNHLTVLAIGSRVAISQVESLQEEADEIMKLLQEEK